MNLTPLPHYFIIKIEIEKQKERKEKIGNLYLHFGEVQMQRNIQAGEIVAMGSIASNNFPQAKIGDTLIIHHFVEGSDRQNSNIIFSSEKYNYYNVTACAYNGHRNESYAVWDGDKIIPHADFVFIEKENEEKEISKDDLIDQKTKQVGSLILFDKWEESRESKEAKAQTIMQEIKNQGRSKNIKHDVKIALEEKQMQAEKITSSLSKQQYIPLKIAYSNKHTKGLTLENKKIVYCLNLAAQTELEFMGNKYFIIESKYCAASA